MIKAIEIEGNFTIINDKGEVIEYLEDGNALLITDGDLLVYKKGERLATIEPVKEGTKEIVEEAWNRFKKSLGDKDLEELTKRIWSLGDKDLEELTKRILEHTDSLKDKDSAEN